MSYPLISVNITTYNRVELLQRCLDGVLAQDYPHFEVIIANDASTDETKTFLNHYAAKDSRIKPQHHSYNQGNAAARNTALYASKGEYVAFMDDDDLWSTPTKLRDQLAIFQSKTHPNLAIVCSGIIRITPDNQSIKEPASRPKNLRCTLLARGLIHNSTVLIPRRIMLEVGGFDKQIPRGVDSEFFRRVVVQYGYDVHFMETLTCYYYENAPFRMTDRSSKSSLLKAMGSHTHNLKKYALYYLTSPLALLIRLRSLGKLLGRYVRRDYN